MILPSGISRGGRGHAGVAGLIAALRWSPVPAGDRFGHGLDRLSGCGVSPGTSQKAGTSFQGYVGRK